MTSVRAKGGIVDLHSAKSQARLKINNQISLCANVFFALMQGADQTAFGDESILIRYLLVFSLRDLHGQPVVENQTGSGRTKV